MRVLVLGGSRFFGKKLVNRLVDEGCEVTIATRDSASQFKEKKQHFGYNWVYLDRRSARSIEDVVGLRRWDIVYDNICFDSSDANNLLSQCNGSVGKVIFTSTQSVYELGSDLHENLRYDENDAHLQASEYARGKYRAECAYQTKQGLPVVICRLPIIIGADDYTRRFHWHVKRIKLGLPIFFKNPAAKISLMSSDDAAEFLSWTKSIDYTGVLNAPADVIAVRDFLKLLSSALNKDAVISNFQGIENLSPFAIPQDWYMSSALSNKLGYMIKPSGDWIYEAARQALETLGERDEFTNSKPPFWFLSH